MRVHCFDPNSPSAMVLIPGGNNSGTDPDFGTYSLTVDSFYMDRHEVSKALWDEVKNWNGGNGYTDLAVGGGKAANHPVQIVSWYDCVKWCNARSQRDGRVPVYYMDADYTQIYKIGQVSEPYVKGEANGYRLPTDVQWEYAARGGVASRRFPWGDTDTIQHARANYYSYWSGGRPYFSYDTSPAEGYHPDWNDGITPYTSPVGSFAANGYGLYDMVGNVWEWSYEWYPGYEGSCRVVRGGGWSTYTGYCRVALRGNSLYSPYANGTVGFRAVRPVIHPSSDYLVIDLSSGPSASYYPVAYLSSVPASGWTDEYKTTKLVLRRIPAGTFVMGSPTNELGRYSDETQHQVTLTQDFYIGVFEMTQKQWERVMGAWPSYFDNVSYRDARPVEQVNYNVVRGSSPAWPGYNNNVDANSFMGRLRARTGRAFDLPTESQWEYAGRAGATTALNSGCNLTDKYSDPGMDEVGRYYDNSGAGGNENDSDGDTSVGTAKVGSYQANHWGLYDMHGNVREWCLDWYGMYPGTVTDPKGPSTGSDRVQRDGNWTCFACLCRVATREYCSPHLIYKRVGFRVVLTPCQ
jgi:formylglycine-generating enzyme required for sulfatase activity